ncbi:DotU family type IV/VI secretion system protein, partial [Enterobacter sp. PTB]|uniref:DotU family type IV/VI secretion system protein n=1 Tax=Enterobacter sp. PTB TaxID=3143437 RepID=UPI003DA9C759
MSGVDIDEVMTRTWLIVTMLRHGAAVPEGKILYQRCCGEIERVREVLEKAGYDRTSIEHISFAQCALLDEAVLRHHATVQGSDDMSGDASRMDAVPKEW